MKVLSLIRRRILSGLDGDENDDRSSAVDDGINCVPAQGAVVTCK